MKNESLLRSSLGPKGTKFLSQEHKYPEAIFRYPPQSVSLLGALCPPAENIRCDVRPAQKPERALLGKGVSKQATSLHKKPQGCRGDEHTQGRDTESSGDIQSFQGVRGNRHTGKVCNSHSSRQRKARMFFSLLLRGSMAVVLQERNN